MSTDLPATSPSDVLTSYPDDELPLDVRTAIVEVGSGVVVAGGAAIGAVERLGSVIRFDRFGAALRRSPHLQPQSPSAPDMRWRRGTGRRSLPPTSSAPGGR